MSVGRIASRYAKSLIQLAREEKKLDRVLEDVESFRGLVKDSADFRNFIKSPIIQVSKKKAILSQLFEKSYDDLTVKFLQLLTQKQRESLLPEIAEEFVLQYRHLRGISTAVITVADELSEETQKLVKEKLEESGIAFDKVELTIQKDPAIIGGFILEIGSQVYDASISKQLNQLKKNFRKNEFVSKI